MTNLVVLPITMANVSHIVELTRIAYESSDYKSRPFDADHVHRGLDMSVRLGNSLMLAIYDATNLDEAIGFVRARIDKVMFYDAPAVGACVFYVCPERNVKGAAVQLLEAYHQHAEMRGVVYSDVYLTSGIKTAHTVALLKQMGYTALGGNFRRTFNED